MYLLEFAAGMFTVWMVMPAFWAILQMGFDAMDRREKAKKSA